MNNYTRSFLLVIIAFIPFLPDIFKLFKNLNIIRGPFHYINDLIKYKNKIYKNKTIQFGIQLQYLYPRFFDRYEEAGSIPRHYFLQDIWAGKKVYESKTILHHDCGSRVDGFIGHCLSFCKVTMIDIRPLGKCVTNLYFKKGDVTNLENICSNSINSLSSLHAIEHVGLGRYGDEIDPDGYIKAINELKRILKSKGNLFFSVPIGLQRLEFNGHRIFNPHYVIELFEGLELIEFSAIDDDDNFIENANMDDFVDNDYSCGLFHFIKP